MGCTVAGESIWRQRQALGGQCSLERLAKPWRAAPCMAASAERPVPGAGPRPLTLKRMKWRVEGCAMMAISRQGAATSRGLVTSMSACRAGQAQRASTPR